jgi:resuscitation-promoting factor RpfB
VTLPALLSPVRRAATGAVQRPLLLVVAIMALTALLATTAVWTMTAKTVTLSVDGAPQQLSTRADTAAEVVEAAGLEVGEHDQLVPSAGTPVEDGDTVALRRARELELVVDGEPRTVWVTAASVEEALDQVGMREQGLALSASRSRPIPLDGLRLDVRTPKSVVLRADGQERTVTTTAATVRDALIEADLHLRPSDRIDAERTDPVTDGLAVTVTRIDTKRVVDSRTVPFGTERRGDASLAQGTTKVLVAGRNGRTDHTYDVTLTDGRETGRTLVSSTQPARPVTRVLAVGTKPAPAAPKAPAPASAPRAAAAPSGGGGHNWAALARCESGGNPRAVSSTGKYRGLYQFSVATWRSVGGSGDPAAASVAEQTSRAQALLARSGRGQWPECGRHL